MSGSNEEKNNSNQNNAKDDSKYSFDENGVAFSFFVATLVGFFIIPKTWCLLFGGSTRKSPKGHTSTSVQCPCDACLGWRKRLQSKWAKSNGGWLSHLTLLVGWVVLSIALAIALTAKTEGKMYDPYVVLGLKPSANAAAVRKVYKKLSLQLHPDKIKPGTDKAAAEKRFIDVSRAYQTITDPEMNRRWLEEGDPDGQKTFKLGIALPLWMVSGKSSLLVLLVYLGLFGVGVPMFVSRLWNRSRSYTKDKLLHETMQMFYRELKEGMNSRKVLEFVALAAEYQPSHLAAISPAVIEKFVTEMNDFCKENSIEHCQVPKKLEGNQGAIKAFVLLFAYTHRIPVPSELNEQLAVVVELSVPLTLGALQICLARKWVPVAQACMHLCQCLVNAAPNESAHPLLMLPWLDASIVKHCCTSKRQIKSVQDLLEMPEEARKSLLRTLTDEQQLMVLKVAEQIPRIKVESIKFQVLGQPEVTPSGIVSAQFKLLLTNHAASPKRETTEPYPTAAAALTEEEQQKLLEDGMEFDEDGNLVEVKKTRILADKRTNPSDPVHAPYFPIEKRPFWWVVLANRALTSLVTLPVKVSDLVPNVPKTITMQFEAPPRTGTIPLRLIIRSDSLLGADLETDCELKIVPEGKQEKVKWEISDEEAEEEESEEEDN